MLSGIGFELELILLQPTTPSIRVRDRARVEGFNKDGQDFASTLILNILISFLSFIFALNASFKQKANE